jgi:hypothetical protein
MTYIVPLAPAVLPTAAQARQLVNGVAKSIGNELKDVSLPTRVLNASVTLDAALFRDLPAPFPANAQAGSNNIMSGWLRATGMGMDLCPPGVGLLAVRTLTREDLVKSVAVIEAAAANGTTLVRGLPVPSRRHNVANTRISKTGSGRGREGRLGEAVGGVDVTPGQTLLYFPPSSCFTARIIPKDDISATPDIALDSAGQTGGALPDVIEMHVAVAGLSHDQALIDMNALRTASRAGKLSRELSTTPGLKAASVAVLVASVANMPNGW